MKKAQVIWSDTALTDLDTIYDFLFQESPAAGQRTIERILSRTRQLETFPESGSMQEVMGSVSVYRYLVEGNYKIVYTHQSGKQVIFIHAVFDTRLDPEKLKL